MGNAASKCHQPAMVASSSRRPPLAARPVVNTKQPSFSPPPDAPPLWKNHERFEIISPASDLSNPSNLDRLKKGHFNKNNKRAHQTPVRERRRTSKVMATRNGTGRLVTKQRTSLPPPDRFYFASGASTKGPQQPQRLHPSTIREEEDHHHPVGAHKDKTLATRAKQALQGCLQVHTKTHEKLDSIPPSIDVSQPMAPLSEIRQPRVNGRRSSTSKETDTTDDDEKYANIVQFDPTLACHVMTVDNPYLHSEDKYFKSLSSSNSQAKGSAQESPQQQKIQTMPSAPVAQLFDHDNTENQVPIKFQDKFSMQNRNDEWLAAVLEISATNKHAWLEARRQRHADKKAQSLESATTIESKNNWQGARASEDSQMHVKPAIESPSEDVAAVVFIESAVEAEPIIESRRLSAEEFRMSIESDVQRQIDSQLAKRQSSVSQGRHGRIQELRTQYQQDLNRISSGHKTLQHPDDLANLGHVSRVQETRELFERKLARSNSLPLAESKRFSQATKKTSLPRDSTGRRRSSSVPPPRQSTSSAAAGQHVKKQEIPALLLLAGWQPTAVTVPLFKEKEKLKAPEKKIDQFPALLKLAGWHDKNGSTKQGNHRLSIQSALPRLQRNKRLTMTFTNRGARKSDPIPRSKPMVGASKSRRTAAQTRRSLSSMSANHHSDGKVRVSSKVAGIMLPKTVTSQYAKPMSMDTDVLPTNVSCGRNSLSNAELIVVPMATKEMERSMSGNGLTTASMLQQTYAIATAHAMTKPQVESSVAGSGTTSAGMDIEIAAQSMIAPKQSRSSSAYSVNHNRAVTTLSIASPVMSLCSIDTQQTTDSRSPCPLVSQQATSNATFLFADADQATKQSDLNRPIDYSISTLASLGRLSGAETSSSRSQGLTIPSRPGTSERTQESTDRRVRFSEIVDAKSPFRESSVHSLGSITVHPGIESRCSDLTDNGDFTPGRVSDPPEIDAIPEEPSIFDEETVCEEASVALKEQDDYADDAKAESIPNSTMRWSYQSKDGHAIGVGVTPMRRGASSAHVTSSPMLRFKEARSKFSSSTTERKPSPVKRSSPVKRVVGGGLVSARVAALMEEQARLEIQSKVQEVSTHHAVFRHSQLNALINAGIPSPPACGMMQTSPMLINGKVVDSPSSALSPASTIAATVVNEDRNFKTIGSLLDENSPSRSEDGSDPFGQITYSKTFDEDSESNVASTVGKLMGQEVLELESYGAGTESNKEDSDDEDAFADLLQDSDDDHTTGDTTVSTVRNESRNFSSAALMNSFASGQTRRISNCKHSVCSTVSADSQTADSVTSIMSRKRLSFASSSESTAPSAVLANVQPVLAFRDDAPVRPTEQKQHRLTPGPLVLSPMQRTPMQARKWRVMAAAAQEKDRQAKNSRRGSSLQERHPNVYA